MKDGTGTGTVSVKDWVKAQIKQDEITPYLENGRDFIDDEKIETSIRENAGAEAERIRAIIRKAYDIKLMDDADVAALVGVTDPGLRNEVFEAAKEIKKKVYDSRIVTFAPLYCGSKCVNSCRYCGFRSGNEAITRRVLTMDEIESEARVLASRIGHKRLVVVYGEHPETDADYIAESMRRIYSIKDRVRNGVGEIRRVNVNAAPMSIADLKKLHEAGIGTYQVFQETYHHDTYRKVHPEKTLKGNFQWRLYALHRAMDAGIDDVAVGALFGLSDWKFEVMGLVAHARDLEKRFGLGPHTVSVPRLEPAADTDFSWVENRVSDDDFHYLVAVLRLAIPYAGLIVTNRESPEMIRSLMDIITQRDADTRVGIGSYTDAFSDENSDMQEEERQQFILGDTRSLDAIIRELAEHGHIVSFCTAGYRCGRTGKKIMTLLESGREGCFCKLNAVLTFQEWLEDFASPETKKIGDEMIRTEIDEIKARVPADFSQAVFDHFTAAYEKIKAGERDLYF
ncbi:[FeFe] hydrogenase H-cluster radical SAM maturase HydG [Brucepastera parasyntrophica]|uniref:[FeFe] hydrogenase H-cluster radical SAM maturase HydG n=1 Tax=Brucepastera parasyntrophica TaxID=2880008 RepID=UPI00210C71E6|nr:[FeFe] hydrogenase H-cluster radical SAM maturase HydG [Brucepastera parasyntrophica]ULQ58456.1 [FeFe] hydrogenase H-cluster radical SAM maturase HydG [Brucepastera parasyntrophica]